MFGLESLGLFGLFVGCFLAATILPFSSDILYITILLATRNPIGCLIVGSLGNWLGGVTCYYLGYIAKWEWLEKYFKIKKETLQKQKGHIDRYGSVMALLTWVPGIGDVIAIALGFYRTNITSTMVFMLIGKVGRFVIWTLILEYF